MDGCVNVEVVETCGNRMETMWKYKAFTKDSLKISVEHVQRMTFGENMKVWPFHPPTRRSALYPPVVL